MLRSVRRAAGSLLLLTLAAIVGLVGASPVQAQGGPQVVNVYSARHYGAMEQVFQRFTQETGIEVRLSQGSAQSLVERLRAEGRQTPADVFMSIDAGTLWIAAEEGLLQPIDSALLRNTIPNSLRDPQDRWFGLSQRARVIVYNPNRVNPSELSTYAALGDSKWRGRLCLGPSSHIYTQALVASFIALHGERVTEQQIVRPWVRNNPRYIDSDTRILETIAAGGCDVGIVNHYYLGQQLARNPNFPVRIFWPNQNEAGAHVNISGMGVTAAARNRANAIRLIEWMATDGKGQGATADTLPGGNFEFPANPRAAVNPIIAGFGSFKIDPMGKFEYGRFQPSAIRLLQRAGYR
ncbi:MAG: extracellular solute-binding protein [Oscillochloridaceae bacterium umkhey_bin13]